LGGQRTIIVYIEEPEPLFDLELTNLAPVLTRTRRKMRKKAIVAFRLRIGSRKFVRRKCCILVPGPFFLIKSSFGLRLRQE
jgi:hypothetical protein